MQTENTVAHATQPTVLAHLRLAGWAFHAGPKLRKLPPAGAQLSLKPEPDNPHDPHAIAVYYGKKQIGYLPAHAAPDYGRLVNDDLIWATVHSVNEITGEVIALALTTEGTPALQALAKPALPPATEFTSALLEAARTEALITALPADLTAAGMSAAYDPGIGYRHVATYAAAPTEATPERELRTRFLPYQHVYLVREEATDGWHERVSVWLPGSRQLGFLQKHEGERLLRTFDKCRPGSVYRAYLDLVEPRANVTRHDEPGTFSIVLLQATVAGMGRAAAAYSAHALASTPVAKDLLRLANDGYPRISDAPAGPADDAGLYLRKDNQWSAVGSSAVADYLRKIEAKKRRPAA